MAFRIEITTIRLPASMRRGNQGQKRAYIRGEIYEAVLHITAEMRKVLAVENSQVVSGVMKKSWQTNTNITSNAIIGRVASNEVSAKVLESGAKPHMPPMFRHRFGRAPGQKGRTRLGGPGSEPVLTQWILKAPRHRGFSWRKFDISKPRDVYRLAYVIGRKFKANGRVRLLKFSSALKRNSPRFALILNQAMRRIADTLRRP